MIKAPFQIGSTLDAGTIIDNIVKKNIARINTCFIAKVVAKNGNKVTVQDMTKISDDINNPAINNCLVAQPYSSAFTINYQVKIDDIGICIVCKRDISHYKENGSEGVANTQRLFSISDSIFIPLSLYKADIENNVIASENNLTMEAKQDLNVEANNIKIKSQEPIVVGNSTGTLKDVVDNLATLMDLLASGMTGSTTNPSAYQAQKDVIIQQIKQIVG